MKPFPLALLVLSGCAGAVPEPLPRDAERYRPAAPAPARPAGPPVAALSLDGAVALAERVHPELARARAQAEAAEGRALQEGLLPNPELAGRLETAPFRGRTAHEAEYLAGVAQRIPAGGRLGAAREAELREAQRLRHEQELKRFEIRSRVQGAFATALFAAEAAKLEAETLDLARRAADVARARRQAGDATADELARIELEEARARLEEARARTLSGLAVVGLAAAVGVPDLRIGAVEGSLDAALEIPALEAVLAALEHGPHAALAKSEQAAADARVARAEAERIPDVTLELFYRRMEAEDVDAFDVGLTLPLPLFDRKQGRLREAQAGRAEAEARGRAARGEAERRAREAHVKAAEALSRRNLIRDELLPRAETVRRAAEARLAAGDASLAEVLPVRRDFAAARRAQLDALRELMEAWGELKLLAP